MPARGYRSEHRGQYFSSLGTAGIGPDTGDERARPVHSRTCNQPMIRYFAYAKDILCVNRGLAIY